MNRTLLISLLLASTVGCNRTEAPPQSTGGETDEAGESPCDDHSGCPPRAHCFCDERGNIVLATLDENGDGRPDRRTVMGYDSLNRRTSIDMDVRVDGTVDARAAYSYDEQGAVIEEWDRNASGVFEARRVFNAAENLLVSESFDDEDGHLERRCIYDPPCPPPYAGPSCVRECTELPAAESGREER